MVREDRYIVLKISDINKALSFEQEADFFDLVFTIGQREAVVVEEDWPIYEATWSLIEAMTDA